LLFALKSLPLKENGIDGETDQTIGKALALGNSLLHAQMEAFRH
jgi:hypothetical protein